MNVRLAALALLLLSVMACANANAPGPATGPRVIVDTAAGASHTVRVELARTEAERAKGLMNRASLEPDAGMLFIFEESAIHGFWMKNTLIPLDMIFIDDAGRVVGIVARAVPHSTELRDVGVPSRYVLEVNGGWAAEHGARAGDRVRFEDVPRF